MNLSTTSSSASTAVLDLQNRHKKPTTPGPLVFEPRLFYYLLSSPSLFLPSFSTIPKLYPSEQFLQLGIVSITRARARDATLVIFFFFFWLLD